jgi:hypothetical protein
MGYAKLLTDRDSRWILDFRMPGHCATSLGSRIKVPRVTRPFLKKKASIRLEGADQVPSLHRLGNLHTNFFSGHLFSFECMLGNRPVRTHYHLNGHAEILTCLVQVVAFRYSFR